MKKIFLLLLLAGCVLSCDVEDETVDTTVMPEATTVGADTFGCLVDGWLYVGGRHTTVDWREGVEDTPSIHFRYSEKQDKMDVRVKVKPYVWISFTILSPKSGQKSDYINARFGEEEMEDGTASITRFDTKRKIISGTFGGESAFEGEGMTKGRFDTHYTTYKEYEEPTQDQ